MVKVIKLHHPVKLCESIVHISVVTDIKYAAYFQGRCTKITGSAGNLFQHFFFIGSGRFKFENIFPAGDVDFVGTGNYLPGLLPVVHFFFGTYFCLN